jgi:excisionase family DNA binding protein
MSMLALLDQG